MKVSELLGENAAVGATAGGAVAGFPGSLFGGGMVSRVAPIKKKKKSKKVNKDVL